MTKIFVLLPIYIDAGILINLRRLNNIRFTDDTVVFAESLQQLVNNIVEKSNEYCLNVNINKTIYMAIIKKASTTHLTTNKL